ncbi:Na+/solute symporter, partial [Suillus lakei]
GVGFFFAAIMLILTTLQRKFFKFSPTSSEEFTSASRSVKPGLVCCGIAWTWSATLLQSSTAAYTFGVSGPWWVVRVGGTIQVAMFGMVASKVKQNANGAHTFLEIVKTRFGTSAHILFTFYGFLCILWSAGLCYIVGGSATVNALTGMNIVAACFLLPVGIAVYVIFGGLRATFICDWSHTIILFIIIYIFTFRAYGTSPAIGSVSRLYDLLEQASIDTPVVGNQGGSYLTMKSNQGLVFGAVTILSGFTGVVCDQGYWQRAIASHPESTTKAYMLGGISWFAVPWAFASCLGLSARALLTNASPPNFPTYPSPLSPSQTSAGLAAPAAAAVLMGKGGAITVLLVVFMAVTSAASAELIGVSRMTGYISIYRTYFRPNATGDEIVRVSHYFICFWAVWMGCWATILHAGNIDLGWLYYVQGSVLSPAVIPIGLTVSWSKLTKAGIFCGAIGGAFLGMLAWMIGCWKLYGQINITNLAQPYSALCSSLTGLFFSGILTVGVSLLDPADYDFSGTRAIATLEDTNGSNILGDNTLDRASDTESQKEKKGSSENELSLKQPIPDVVEVGLEKDEETRIRSLKMVFRRALIYSSILTVIVVILVPLPMFFSHYIFSKKFYTFWTACSIIWAFASGTFCIVLPLWESRNEIGTILGSTYRSIRKRSSP